ncbi:hypothetical protein [Micromonospora carbonacea]|uniref:Uncharacterized protein n=1 Tax=Micromonospora carbonacea TaxID=47853 RepID=A0A1C4WYK7_9ACTN|nr:hypothetical protein [Micromonospora carbonacea]SCF00951.1 hypothetical protein GA0070563_104100 [Micromonospora carbonacea]
MTTNPLYTDADITLAAEAIARVWGYRSLAEIDSVPDVEGPRVKADARAVLDALAAAGRLAAPTPAPTPPYVHHLLDAYLTGQPLNFHTDPVPLDVQRRLEHAVATGQMGTVPAPAGHVLTVTGDGLLAVGDGWMICHPADCTVHTPTGPILVCLVQDLAVEQNPAAKLPPGRYEIEANDLGDRLCIFDRQTPGPTPPPGGGCFCEDPAGRDYGHTSGAGLHCGPAPNVEYAIRVDTPHPRREEKTGDIITTGDTEVKLRARDIWHGWTPVQRTVTAWTPVDPAEREG